MLFERWDIDSSPINLNEIKLIADKIKDSLKGFKSHNNIMTKDYGIISNFDYYQNVRDLMVNPNDAIAYIRIDFNNHDLLSHFPFTFHDLLILEAYLSKQGFHYDNYVVPATGLKYVALAEFQRKRILIEILDLDNIANKLNIPRIVTKVLSNRPTKELGSEDRSELARLLDSQKVLGGHSLHEAYIVLINQYDKRDKVARIISSYKRIFVPLAKACYDKENWNKRIECPTKLEPPYVSI